ncbi:serine hydrolase domain-containing protein [Conexibacter stalactiti]|uniref:Serine hydrolase domain-containing protein n=1 Tax=Conexibacter stalactiti TaxID=1940611 RepID=A0ABU4HQ79_9ACTN|nr:serine hydrolase domain-containing protein [Conexibacter stalactiti]MDW5595441.1 serine hydrolase domain-containing protein [Conexibacter stalactiti]MEC5036083.1 serine hydrolase domain-containing protein [Conexibacter stalactiti]
MQGTVEGHVAPGYEPVADEFARNFAQRGELGAAFAVAREGEIVVDLWGGVADRASGRPWTADTAQILFSGAKGLVATCLLMLIERGALELDAPVVRYWPEFGAAGKQRVTVREIVSHTARLPGLETPVTWQEATDAQRMAELLAGQRQSDDPRAIRTYHAMTFGWLAGELVRRVDGRTVGRFFAEEVAAPLALDLWIGLPPELEPRVATVELAADWGSAETFGSGTGVDDAAADPLRWSVFQNPLRYDRSSFPWNEPAWHQAEVPSSNAIGTARSIARLYDGLGELLSPATLELAVTPLSSRWDPLLDSPTTFGVAFQLQTERRPLGPPAGAYGHGGSGGSRHGRWPEQRLGFSYAMNLMRESPDDERGLALLGTLHACVTKVPA